MSYNEGMRQEIKNTGKMGWKIAAVVFAVLVTVFAVIVIINRITVRDFLRGLAYQPTVEVAVIRDKLQLTDWGEFVFNASQPELNERDDFNRNCYSMNEETAVLGCYTNENIYVYNIKEQKLDGIRELTAAHELLHAIYARLSQDEKASLEPILRQVYQENIDILDKDVKQYLQGEQLEEIYVRAGTEVKKLPETLEAHYAKVFSDQDAVVSFYEKYISVFRELETKLDNLEKEMAEIKATMDEKTASYENRAAEFSARVNEFNDCANIAGCFDSAWEFYMQRNQLVMEQESLTVLYDEISDLLDRYNTKVNEYNENVIKSNRLNQIINSNQKVEAIN